MYIIHLTKVISIKPKKTVMNNLFFPIVFTVCRLQLKNNVATLGSERLVGIYVSVCGVTLGHHIAHVARGTLKTTLRRRNVQVRPVRHHSNA